MNDLISRKALLKKSYEVGKWMPVRVVAVDDIENAPAIEANPVKHGKWKLHEDGSGTCDQCHFTQKNVWDYDNEQRYCGVCGARMDGDSA